MSIEDKLKEAKKLGKEPAKLSEPEKENLTGIIAILKEILDEVLIKALEMPKDDAFKFVRAYTTAIEYAETNLSRPDFKPPDETEESEEIVRLEPVEHPKLEKVLAGLSEESQRKARELLTCVKTYLRLEEKGEDGSEALCPDCTPERVIECIRVEDPTVVDELDKELRAAGVIR